MMSEPRMRETGFSSLHERLDTTAHGGWLVYHVFAAPADIIRAARDMLPAPDRFPYRWTTGHVSVRATPPRACTRDTINLASSSMFRASARAMTSYGPVTVTASETLGRSRRAADTTAAWPTSVWIRTYAATM